MNSAASPIDFGDFSHPIRLNATMKPIPQLVEPDLDHEDILLFSSFEELDVPQKKEHLPARRPTLLDTDRMVLPSSVIRRIEHELREDQCDPRTVFQACRGLTKGTQRFEEAYIAARIRSYAKSRRHAVSSVLATAVSQENGFNEYRPISRYDLLPPPSHPMAVHHLGHLMRHFGIWVMMLLGLQFWSSARLSAFANVYLEGGRPFYFGVALALMIAADSWVWFRRQGNLSSAFHLPGVILFLMALLPIFALHLHQVLTQMK